MMKNENIHVRLAQATDIPQVKKLLERYHAKNLEGEQRANGFVTTDMTEQQLIELCNSENGVIIAVDKSDDKIIGLLLGASWKFLKPWPMFDYMADILKDYAYQGQQLSAETSYQYGPICVAEEYRSNGVGELLLEYQRKVFSTRYPVIVTFVNVLNPRSYAFHTRNEFEDVGKFKFNGNNYHMMALPTSV
ncbi:GNAT family N-acetyltransferase [Serratia sp. MYb239]|uniref:GNAT family N-acetyltransferase n=1 Tax=Serratia sp. MYb239 TaxID=2033438 RepID=UPI001E5DF47E|nr:GNAT family N-acetyltransferase [Serratia sp. MYb239]